MEKWKLFIHGRFVCAAGAKTIPVLNKATGETVACVPESSRQDVDDAIASASTSFSRWRQMPVHERAAILHRTATAVREQIERLAQLLTTEVGKPLADARGEVTAVAGSLDFFAEEGKRIRGEIPQLNGRDEQVMILKEPVGVSWKLRAALAAGCTLVAQPAAETPFSTLTLASIMAEAGLPAGVFNVVTGYGHTVGATLVAHPVPRKVAFTGGVESGKKIYALAAQTNKRVTLEMGGQCPAIVCNDADLGSTRKPKSMVNL